MLEVEAAHSLRGDKLVVTDDGFYWEGYEKHTDRPWETGEIQIALLDSEPGSIHILCDEDTLALGDGGEE